jgi:predicted ATPase
LTSFIGREKELKEVAGLFAKSRLITLTGAGGVGKTRLAIQVVADVLERFPDGVWFLDLAPLSDPALVPRVAVTTLGLLEQSGRSPMMILTDFLQTRRALLILDNCEHIIQACAQLAETLLSSCPDLCILATSRESLRIGGELPYRVPSLEFPTSDIEFAMDKLSNMESLKLFIQRAQVGSPTIAISQQSVLTIAQICQRLDGIPLAIELAAARSNMLTVEQILKRLDDRFILLTGGSRTSLPRHQTLHATIDWSYNLLSIEEQFLLGRLSVFAGGCTLEAAQFVCGGNGLEMYGILDLLTQLFDKSLVLAEQREGQEIRYYMLETIRQYGREKLSQAGEEESICQRHLTYFVELAERAGPNLRAFGMIIWLNRLEAELSNIREALEYALKRDVEAELRLASALQWFWHIRAHKKEGIDWLEAGLSIEATERGDQLLTPRRAMIRGKALNASGFLVVAREIGNASPSLEESLSLFKAIGPAGEQGRAYALLRLSEMTSEPIRRRSLLEESLTLFREIGDKFGVAECLLQLLSDVQDEGDYGQALGFAEEHLALRREIGDDDGIAAGLADLGHLALQQDNYQLASKLYKESLVGFRKVGNKRAFALALSGLSHVAWAQGNYEEATRISEQALALGQDLDDKAFVARRLHILGRVAWAQGDYEDANQKFEAALTVSRATEYKPGIAFSLYGVGRVAQSQQDYAKARLLYTEAIVICQERRDPFMAGFHLEAIATLAAAQKQMKRAARLFGAAETLFPSIRLELSAAERAEHDQAVAATRAALGEEGSTQVWEEGQKMTLDEAVAYAIESL